MAKLDQFNAQQTTMSPLKKPTVAQLDVLFTETALSNLRLPKSTPQSLKLDLALVSKDALLSRFGLQNSGDVVSFLHSPAGKEAEAICLEELEEIASFQQNVRFQMTEAEKAHHRRLAYLLLAFASRASHAKSFLEEYLNQHHLLELKDKKQATTVSATLSPAQAYADYAHAEVALNEKHLDVELNLFEARLMLDEVVEYHHQIEAEWGAMEAVFDGQLSHLSKAQLTEELTALKLKHEATISDIAEGLKRVQQPSPAHKTAFSQLLGFRAEALRAQLLKQEGQTQWYDSRGQLVSHLKETAFIVEKSKKIVQDNGVMYLLKHDAVLSQLSNEDKQQAAEAFKKLSLEQKPMQTYLASFKKAHDEQKHLALEACQTRIQQLTLHRELVAQKMQDAKTTLLKLDEKLAQLGQEEQKLLMRKPVEGLVLTAAAPTSRAFASPTNTTAPTLTQSKPYDLLNTLLSRLTQTPVLTFQDKRKLFMEVSNLPRELQRIIVPSLNQIEPGRPLSPDVLKMLMLQQSRMLVPLKEMHYSPVKENPSPFATPRPKFF